MPPELLTDCSSPVTNEPHSYASLASSALAAVPRWPPSCCCSTLFVQPVFDVMVEALELPWTPTVYLPPLLPRFYRLTLQTIARFHTW